MSQPSGESVERDFAANVRAIREDRGLSQEQLAEAMNKRGHSWHQATVYKVENGSRSVQISEAHSLAAIFNVEIDTLISASAEARATATVVQRLAALQTARFEFQRAYADWHMWQLALKYTVTSPEDDQGDDVWTRPALAERQGIGFLPGARERLSRKVTSEIERAIHESSQDIIDELAGPGPAFDVNDPTT